MFDDKFSALRNSDGTCGCGKNPNRGAPAISSQRRASYRTHIRQFYGLPSTDFDYFTTLLVKVVVWNCGRSNMWGFYQPHAGFCGTSVVARGYHRDSNISSLPHPPRHNSRPILVSEAVCGCPQDVPSVGNRTVTSCGITYRIAFARQYAVSQIFIMQTVPFILITC